MGGGFPFTVSAPHALCTVLLTLVFTSNLFTANKTTFLHLLHNDFVSCSKKSWLASPLDMFYSYIVISVHPLPSIKQASYAETDRDRWLEDCCLCICSIAFSSDRMKVYSCVCGGGRHNNLYACHRLIGGVGCVPPRQLGLWQHKLSMQGHLWLSARRGCLPVTARQRSIRGSARVNKTLPHAHLGQLISFMATGEQDWAAHAHSPNGRKIRS